MAFENIKKNAAVVFSAGYLLGLATGLIGCEYSSRSNKHNDLEQKIAEGQYVAKQETTSSSNIAPNNPSIQKQEEVVEEKEIVKSNSIVVYRGSEPTTYVVTSRQKPNKKAVHAEFTYTGQDQKNTKVPILRSTVTHEPYSPAELSKVQSSSEGPKPQSESETNLENKINESPQEDIKSNDEKSYDDYSFKNSNKNKSPQREVYRINGRYASKSQYESYVRIQEGLESAPESPTVLKKGTIKYKKDGQILEREAYWVNGLFASKDKYESLLSQQDKYESSLSQQHESSSERELSPLETKIRTWANAITIDVPRTIMALFS